MKARVRNRIIFIIIVIVAVLVAVRIRSIVHVSLKSEASETRLVLEAMADQDMNAIQEQIDLVRSLAEPEETESYNEMTLNYTAGVVDFSDFVMPSLEELKQYNYKEMFSDAALLGDSIAEGVSAYDILNSSEVFAKIGISVYQADNLLYSAASFSPKVAFLAFGLNDTGVYENDFDQFEQAYEDFLALAQELMPNTAIYAILILPVQELAIQNDPYLSYIGEYNQKIIEACDARGVPYMDLGFTFYSEYYETDGYHAYPDFYYGWLYCMAKGAGMI